jgi:hypothetical protein
MKAVNKKLGLLAICAGALTLVACGGDSATVSLNVTGVAAKGLAIVGGDVTAQCVSGTLTTPVKTNDSGRYTFSLNNATGPCLIKVSYPGGTLYSLSRTTTDGNVYANVTPVSDAIVSAFVARFNGSRTDLVTVPALIPQDYQIAEVVAAVLVNINAALANIPGAAQLPLGYDLLGDQSFVAATSPTSPNNNVFDLALDALVTSGNSLPQELLTTITQTTGSVVLTPTGGVGTGGGL